MGSLRECWSGACFSCVALHCIERKAQVCVCPEYVLVTPDIEDALIEAFKEVCVHISDSILCTNLVC